MNPIHRTQFRTFALVAVCFCTGNWVSPPTATAQQTVVIVLDDSGSMSEPMRDGSGGTKMDAARKALSQVLVNLPADARVGVVALNSRSGGSNWIAPLGPIDRDAINQQISQIKADGGTPLGAAMGKAADQLIESRQQSIYGTYRMLVVTDGEASDSQLVQQYLPLTQSKGIIVDAIGVQMRGNHSLATEVHSYRRADDLESLKSAIEEVFAETSDDDATDGSQSDYELLEPIPSGVATQALAALSRVDHSPVTNTPTAGSNNRSGSNAPVNSVPANSSQPLTTDNSSGSGAGAFCCLAVMGTLIIVPMILLKTGGKKSR